MQNFLKQISDIFYSLSRKKTSQTDDYFSTAQHIYSLIEEEFRQAESKTDVAEIYPKLVISVEFFRYLRGEFFNSSHPAGTGNQKNLYKMEDSLSKKLAKIKNKLDLSDSRTQSILGEAKKLF